MKHPAPGVMLAGDIDSPAAPTDPASAMPTLEDLYNRLVSGAGYTLRTTFVEPVAGPGEVLLPRGEFGMVAYPGAEQLPVVAGEHLLSDVLPLE